VHDFVAYTVVRLHCSAPSPWATYTVVRLHCSASSLSILPLDTTVTYIVVRLAKPSSTAAAYTVVRLAKSCPGMSSLAFPWWEVNFEKQIPVSPFASPVDFYHIYFASGRSTWVCSSLSAGIITLLVIIY
jgi:hypothetical protein